MLMGQVYNALPFLFLIPIFKCTNKQILCSEQIVCKELEINNTYQYYTYPTFNRQSITSQYQLYCQNKITIASLQTIHMLGHFCGCIGLIITSSWIKPKIFLKIISFCWLIIGICLCLCLFTNQTMFSIVYFIWPLMFEIPNTLIPTAIAYYFQQEKVGIIFAYLNLFFSAYTIFNPLLFHFSFSWRSFLCIYTGIPSIILAASYWYVKDKVYILKNKNIDQQESSITIRNSNKSISMQHSPITLLQIYKSNHFISFISMVIVSFYPFFIGILVLLKLNTLSGNFIINYQLYATFQVCGGLFCLWILHHYPPRQLIYFFFSLAAFFLLTQSLLPIQFKAYSLIISKFISDVLWGIIAAYTILILPKQVLVNLHSIKFCFMMCIGIITPFITYLAWLWKFDVFFFAGLVQLTGLYFLYLAQKHKSIKSEQKKQKLLDQIKQ